VAPDHHCFLPSIVSDSGTDAQNIDNKRTKELSEEELTILRDEVSKYQVEGDLVRSHRRRPNTPQSAEPRPPAPQRRFNLLAIKRLQDINSYRGRRHRSGLPVRGAFHPGPSPLEFVPVLTAAGVYRTKHQAQCPHTQGQEGHRGRQEEGERTTPI
jgi:hypothetical protein